MTVPNNHSQNGKKAPVVTVLVLFGTRPEIIKLAPVIHALTRVRHSLNTINVLSGQHTDLIRPFVDLFQVKVDYDLNVMRPGQSLNRICSRALDGLDEVLAAEQPDLVLVQGDTTTALTGAIAAFHRRIAVGHVEAGLRSGDRLSPYPEEMNRTLITRLATYHFAATERARDNLLGEGVDPKSIFLTGNPVVDALLEIRKRLSFSPELEQLLQRIAGKKRIVLTTHRRESFGETMLHNLQVLRRFVEQHEDVVLLFPVHPNPTVRDVAFSQLSGHERIHLLDPLGYLDFIGLLSSAWLIVSDSGGVQEEAPTLKKPLIVLREKTERPEAVECGVAQLVGTNPDKLQRLLESTYQDETWACKVATATNPFGQGDSGERIVRAIVHALEPGRQTPQPMRV